MEGVVSPGLHFVVAYFVLVTIPVIVALSLKTLLSQVFELLMAAIVEEVMGVKAVQ